MTRMRMAAQIAALTIAVAACGRGEAPAGPAYEMNALLDHVPVDTPYLAANLARLPDAFVDTWLLRLQPVLEEMQTQLTAVRTDLEQASGTGSGAGAAQAGLPLAVLRALDGKLSRTGLESLGLDIGAHSVVYGMGAFPVFRIGLSDAGALRATVQRILDEAGVAAPQHQFEGVSYWRLAAEGRDEVPVGLYLAILEDHLAAGVLPQGAEQQLLPAFLGLETPPAGDAGDRLLTLNEAHGYTPFGSAIVDFHRLADQFLQHDALTAEVMAASGHYGAGALGPDCIAEIHTIIDQIPHITAGTTELTAGAIGYQYRVESPPTLAGRLMDLVAEIPAVEAASTRMLDFAFGMRFGAVRDFVQETAAAIVAAPFVCEPLQRLNDGAADALARLERPMPPFVNNFRGIRISLDDIRLEGGPMPAAARGHLAVHVEKPEMFVGMAQMFLPDLSELAITAGDPPVPVPESLLPAPDMVAFAAMSKDAIGMSVGAGEEQGLIPFLNRDAGPQGTFLSVSYDSVAYMDFTNRFAAERTSGQHGEHRHPEAAEAAKAIAEAGQSAIRASADRSFTTLRFGPEGLVIDGRMTFR